MDMLTCTKSFSAAVMQSRGTWKLISAHVGPISLCVVLVSTDLAVEVKVADALSVQGVTEFVKLQLL